MASKMRSKEVPQPTPVEAKQLKPKPPARGKILSFKNSDIPNLEDEGDKVEAALNSIKCPAPKFKIESEQALENELRIFLRGTTPRIIYYHGHGGIKNDKLVLSR